MPKQCPKCSYIRNESDAAPSTECPSCGVIFSKFKLTCPRCKHVASAEEVTKPGTCPECGVDINWFIQSTREKKRSSTEDESIRRTIRCSDCSEQVHDGATTCPNGHLQIFSKDRAKKSVHPHMKQLLGLSGSIILFVGVFAPIVSVPIMGNINFFQNGKGDGIIVLVLAVASLALVLIQRYKWLWLTGTGCLGVTMFTFINFQLTISQMKSQMESQLAENPFRGLVDMTMQSIQLQWGWALLIVGAGLVIASAALREELK